MTGLQRRIGRLSTAVPSLLSVLTVLTLSGLIGCGTSPTIQVNQPTTGGALAAIPSPERLAQRTPAQALADFEALHRTRANESERLGHWAQAAWHWEALRALRPEDAQLAESEQKARQAADSLAMLRVAQARLVLQMGDTAATSDLLIKALAAQPTLRAAADSLRVLAREQVRRAAAATTTRHRANSKAGYRPEFEQAQLLALQGELAAAVDLLAPIVRARPADSAARHRLADFTLQLAQQRYATDPKEATTLAHRSLQLDPGLSAARQTLDNWARSANQPPTPSSTR